MSEADVLDGLRPTGEQEEVEDDPLAAAEGAFTHGGFLGARVGGVEHVEVRTLEVGGGEAVGDQDNLTIGSVLCREELPGLLEASGRLELVDGEYSQALGRSVRFHFSDGHTPGLMLAEIVGPEHSGGEDHGGVVFCADLIPGRPWVHVPITMGYDRNAELLIDEKRAFLEDMLARNVHLFFTHDPGCALAQVTRDDKGKFGTAHEHAELRARAIAA